MLRGLGILVAAMLALAGCSNGRPSMVVLKDPKTGQMAQCQGDGSTNWNPYAATEACAKGYEASGWVRVTEY